MTRQTMHQGKKLHYAYKDFPTGKIHCIQKDCNKNHTKSLIITLACGCQKVFNDAVINWTAHYGVENCKTRRHGNRK